MATTTTTTPIPPLSFSRQTFAKLSPHPYLLAHLQPASSTTNTSPTRANGRLPSQARPPHINTSSLTHAQGSAVVRLGDTTVVCGVRAEILGVGDVGSLRIHSHETKNSHEAEHSNEAKALDLLVPNIELATGCSPQFMPGQPPSMLAQSLSTRVYSLLHSSRLVRSEELRIWYVPEKIASPSSSASTSSSKARDEVEAEDGDDEEVDKEREEREVEEAHPELKAFWTLYIDILFISLDGNPFDAAWAATLAALRDVRLPRAYWDVDREMILCSPEAEEAKRLSLRGLPVASTFMVFRAREASERVTERTGEARERCWVLADPDAFEEELCEEGVTVVVDCSEEEGKVLGIEKYGGTVIGKGEMRELVGLAEKRWEEWQTVLVGADQG